MFTSAENSYLIPPGDSSSSLNKTSGFRFCSALPFRDACVGVDVACVGVDYSSGWQKSETETVGKQATKSELTSHRLVPHRRIRNEESRADQ